VMVRSGSFVFDLMTTPRQTVRQAGL